uniref:Uncharacterized protein n=1 Tax=Fagus sylvatica TaxID=28930 RepID=A0A2N9FWG7_FAGSY
MSTNGAEVLEVLALGGVFFEEQLEKLGALVRLCGDEECFKEVIGAEPDSNNEACGDCWSSSRVADPHRGCRSPKFFVQIGD